MPLVEQETALRKPPPSSADVLGQQVNRWVWDRLCFALPLLEAGPGGYRDVVTGVRPAATVGTVAGGRDERGQVMISQPGGANYLEYDHQPAHAAPSDAVTVHARFRSNGVVTSGGGIYGKVHTDDTDVTWGVVDNGLNQLNGWILTSASATAFNTDLQATGTLPAGVWVHVFYRWSSGGLTTIDVLADGGAALGQQARSSAGVGGTLTYSAAGPLRVFATDVKQGMGGDISVLLCWARKLSDAEMAAIATDPFLAFRRPNRQSARLFPTSQPLFGQPGAGVVDATVDPTTGAIQTLGATMPADRGGTLTIVRGGVADVNPIAAGASHSEAVASSDPQDPEYVRFEPDPGS